MKLPGHFPKRNYQAIIFDCDGTLVDSMPLQYEAWVEAMSAYGITFPQKQFYDLAGVPTEAIIGILSREQNKVVADVKQASALKEKAFIARIDRLRPIQPVVDVARYFHGKIPLAVASGGPREVIERQLKVVGCSGWFEAIVAAGDTERAKPHPDVFLEAARRLKVEPEQCLVYEDADLGVQAAKAAGMDFVDVREIRIKD